MGKASKRNTSADKATKRAKNVGGSPAKASFLTKHLFPIIIILVLVAGLVAIVSLRRTDINAAPRVAQDHWHASYGIYNCDQFVASVTDQTDALGVHTHADGLLHIHPFSPQAAGANSKLSLFFDTVGMEYTDTSLSYQGLTLEDGMMCNGEPAVLQYAVWNDAFTEGDPVEVGRGTAADFVFTPEFEFGSITIGLVPEGTDLPRPDQSIAALADYAGLVREPAATLAPDPDVTIVSGESDVTTSTP